MEFDMWAGGVAAAGVTRSFVEECSKTFRKLADQTIFDLIFKEDCFEDLTPTIYESQKARYKQTVEDLGLYHHYLETSLIKELSGSTAHLNIGYLLEIRAVTFGYREQHLQCLRAIDNMGDLRELPSAEIHQKNKIVFGVHLRALKAKYELFVETIFKAHGHTEFNDKLLREYITLTSDIWSDIEKEEVELKDMVVQQIEPWKETLYATRHRVLYPFYEGLYEVYPTILNIQDVSEITDVIVLDSEIADIYSRLRKWILDIQCKKLKLTKVCEEIEMLAEGRQDLINIKYLSMSEYEEVRIYEVILKAEWILNMCNKLGQVEVHTLLRLSNVISNRMR